jgi:uracil-DNA glycosylase
MPDNRYTLQVIKDAWENCTRCNLGVRRKEVKGQFVFGEGSPRGIMFIGEGPGVNEEEEGRPFVGRSGRVLRQVIHKLGLSNCSYITNVVTCRSCSQAYSGEGQPIMRWNRALKVHEPLIRDEPPSPLQIASCLPRLYEEIYLVDPVLIVTLGGEAAKAIISERSFSIINERGKTREITIPGAWFVPELTDKKKMWLRKTKGEYVMPTTQNEVRYLMMPTLHPAYVLRRQEDRSYKNPLDTFIIDMKEAAKLYDRYLLETFGTEPTERDVTIDDVYIAAESE